MFDIFRKNFEIASPVDGGVIELSQVPDQVFAQKLAGDGVAIDSTGDTIVAPADGTLTLVFRTNHAFVLTLDNGIELLVHIGLDTVELSGEGFKRIAKEGSTVSKGDTIIEIDRKFIEEKGCSLITPVLITNIDKVKELNCAVGNEVKASKESIIYYKIK